MKNFILPIATAATMVATPVMAAPVEGNSFEDHQQLWDNLNRAGVTTLINSTDCEKDLAGFYWIPDGKPQLVVCQENSYPGGPEVGWTAFDLDTLRHEAHHVIQDCANGAKDLDIVPIMEAEWALNVLGEAQASHIAQTYASNGATPSVIRTEFEAFAVAETIPASAIADGVERVCQFQF